MWVCVAHGSGATRVHSSSTGISPFKRDVATQKSVRGDHGLSSSRDGASIDEIVCCAAYKETAVKVVELTGGSQVLSRSVSSGSQADDRDEQSGSVPGSDKQLGGICHCGNGGSQNTEWLRLGS